MGASAIVNFVPLPNSAQSVQLPLATLPLVVSTSSLTSIGVPSTVACDTKIPVVFSHASVGAPFLRWKSNVTDVFASVFVFSSNTGVNAVSFEIDDTSAPGT